MTLREITKYVRNRNLWKKSSTSFRRQKSRILDLVDGDSGERYSFDITKAIRFRDPYQINKGTQGDFFVDFVIGEYEEGIINVENDSSGIGIFTTSFSGTPYIVLELETANYGYVTVACSSVVSSSFAYITSNDFSGSIRYRAVYSTSYPAIVSSSFSSSFVISAGSQLMNDTATFSDIFSTGVLSPVLETRATPVFLGNPFVDTIDTNVAVTQINAVNNIDNGSIAGSVSAPLTINNEIHYLVVLDY